MLQPQQHRPVLLEPVKHPEPTHEAERLPQDSVRAGYLHAHVRTSAASRGGTEEPTGKTNIGTTTTAAANAAADATAKARDTKGGRATTQTRTNGDGNSDTAEEGTAQGRERHFSSSSFFFRILSVRFSGAVVL